MADTTAAQMVVLKVVLLAALKAVLLAPLRAVSMAVD